MKVALDAMGGDHAPATTVEGAVDAVNRYRGIEVVLVGDEPKIRKELSIRKYPGSQIGIEHAAEAIGMEESISMAVLRKKGSSMRKAVEMVKAGKADAVVTAGNSGAAMALALLLIGPSEGVDRPAIGITIPCYKKPFLLIDAGANVDCSPGNLLQFALMGDAYGRLIMGRPRPRVALLSIGEEATKGNELTKEAYKLLEGSGINFTGNIEGKDIYMGDADVVVCDGFVGNIVLKTSEGLADVIIKMLKKEISGMTVGGLGYFLIKPAIKSFKKKTDYDEYGGAPLLGINGTCIISHGRSTAKAIRNAIKLASDFSEKRVHEAVAAEVKAFRVAERAAVAG